MEKQSAAPTATPPSAHGGRDSSPSKIDQTIYQRNLFLTLFLTMTWQLAVVVIVPLVGGYQLDQHLHTSPWFMLLGILLTILGIVGVLLRINRDARVRTGGGK
jgi:F0F1-type ATP synthase assembly protein I